MLHCSIALWAYLSKELDRDLWRRFLNCVADLIRGLGKPVSIDIDAHPASRTCHVLACLEPPHRLLEVLAAIRALKPHFVSVRIGHARIYRIAASMSYKRVDNRAGAQIFFGPTGNRGF